jgi:ketosteroid isomerase-like protein
MDAVSAIRTTIVRYGQCIDDRDVEGLLALYTVDAVHHANGRDNVGHDGIRAWITGAFPRIEHIRHLVLGSAIEVDGDSATGISDWMTVQRLDDGSAAIHSVGRFDDRFRLVDGRWRFTERRLRRFAGARPGAVSEPGASGSPS